MHRYRHQQRFPIRFCANLWVSVSVSVFVTVSVSGRVNAPLDPAGLVDIKDRNHNILVEKTSNILVHNKKSLSDVFFLFFSFLTIFGGHKPYLWGHWYLCFGLLVTSALVFKVRVGDLIRTWRRRTCYMLTSFPFRKLDNRLVPCTSSTILSSDEPFRNALLILRESLSPQYT